ncbi:methyltransferase domain-containing protein [Nitratireductor sp. L1-7-SE]|uniref:Methyltransferase domain-containing protein n=1 Tax=Nitratireductor rhodophyticola TaxID=2854036 RepID=A0ABS7REK9_9HYPH|nr:class I SAM-dependent methyltransferase [Nitratireductor rhodophyticola]MBY8918835.1 methyltransferase domain-containing protein [Nitratireductor rhodophyticola]MBY8919982.1 methyltransferase domain-containing protein [Nitratireductor rhodophyticola]
MKNQNPNDLARQARKAEKDGYDVDAASLYSHAIGLKGPDSPAWWFVRLANAHVRIGNKREALKAYDQAARLDPSNKGWAAAVEELRKWQESNNSSIEASAEYYDRVYQQSDAYRQAGEDTPYAEMWTRIREKLCLAGSTKVLDIGCGPGQFAAFLHAGWDGNYHGLDFSDVAVQQASSRGLPYIFHCGDAQNSELLTSHDYDAVVCTEVLEHVDGDIQLLQRIRPGVFCLCSVPSFYAFGHVRFFQTPEHVSDRYSPLLNELEVEEFLLPSNERIYLFSGTRKDD